MQTEEHKIRRRPTLPNLTVLALVSFIASFAVARVFSSLFPTTRLLAGGFHIHHFWYGIVMLAIGGWLGISYDDERMDRIAVIIFGIGGGLIGDEVGLLLTDMQDYWTVMTYTFLTVFVALISVLILTLKYSNVILGELKDFTRTKASLFVGVFLVIISVAFMTDVDNLIVVGAFGIVASVASVIILTFLVQRLVELHRRNRK